MKHRDPSDDAASLMSLAQLLLYPLRGQGGLLMLACATGLYMLAAIFDLSRENEGFHLILALFLPVAVINVVGVLQLHAWMSLRHVALGHTQTLRNIAVTDVSPYQNFLAFKVALLLAFVVGIIVTGAALSSLLGGFLVVVFALTLPAMLGVIALEQRFRDGLDPHRVAQLAWGLGTAYVPFAAALLIGTSALIISCTVMSPPRFLAVVAAGYLFVLAHVLAGRLLYLRRRELSLATSANLSRAQVETQQIEDSIDTLMLELHGLCRSGQIKRAKQVLDDFLAASDYSLDEHIHQRLQLFQEQRLLLAHARQYISRLLAAHRALAAWLVLRKALDVDSRFRPDTAEALLALIAQAPAADADRVDRLLEDFDNEYPDSACRCEALFARARWCMEAPGRYAQALRLSRQIEREFPSWQDTAYESFRARLLRHPH